MLRTNATTPDINVIEPDNDYKIEVATPDYDQRRFLRAHLRQQFGHLY
jgi:hypothetical protein